MPHSEPSTHSPAICNARTASSISGTESDRTPESRVQGQRVSTDNTPQQEDLDSSETVTSCLPHVTTRSDNNRQAPLVQQTRNGKDTRIQQRSATMFAKHAQCVPGVQMSDFDLTSGMMTCNTPSASASASASASTSTSTSTLTLKLTFTLKFTFTFTSTFTPTSSSSSSSTFTSHYITHSFSSPSHTHTIPTPHHPPTTTTSLLRSPFGLSPLHSGLPFPRNGLVQALRTQLRALVFVWKHCFPRNSMAVLEVVARKPDAKLVKLVLDFFPWTLSATVILMLAAARALWVTTLLRRSFGYAPFSRGSQLVAWTVVAWNDVKALSLTWSMGLAQVSAPNRSCGAMTSGSSLMRTLP